MNNSNSQLVTHLPRTSTLVQPKWLNKDRYWNLVFATIMTLGMFIAFTVKDFVVLSGIIFWFTLIGTPLLVRYFNKVAFVEDKRFLTYEGREINVDTDFPSSFIIVTIAAIVGLWFFLSKNGQTLPVSLSVFILTSALFFIPALCFSFKNCPISILFNFKFWQIRGDIHNMPYRPYEYKPSYHSSSDRYKNDLATNPIYGCLSSNIFNKYR